MNLKEYKISYQKDGLIVLKNFINPKLIKQFNKDTKKHAKYLCNKYNIFSDDYLNDGLIQLDKINHSEIDLFYNLIRNSASLNQIIYNKRILNIIKYLLKVDSMLYTKYHIVRIDPPEDERFLYKWHQESYYSIPKTPSIQLWAPLINSNNKENGTIDVLVGSHKKELPHYLEKVPDGHIQLYIEEKDIKKKYKKLKVELTPGDIVLFHPYLIHRSNSNSSNKIRYSIVGHYINPMNKNFYIDKNDFVDINQKKCVNYASFYNK